MTGQAVAPILGIAIKPRQSAIANLAKKLVTWAEARKIDLRLDLETANEIGFSDEKRCIERRDLTKTCGVIVVLGGDGTLISVCRHAVSPPPMIIGVNAGTLGFLTEITVDEMLPVLESVLNNTARLEPRSLLYAEVRRKGKCIAEYSAMNDVVISKEALARMFSVEVTLGNDFAAMIRGDGVIVSSPGGSTAYSLSAGGSIVHPQVDALLVTPICPHSLSTRPLVVPGDSTVSMVLASPLGHPTTGENAKEVYLTIDGQEGMELQVGDNVVVKTSDHKVIFVKSPSRTYFDVLGAKLKWATR